MTKRAFISHISEEAEVAGRLKQALTDDFLGLVDIFVSSDAESILAGDDWLNSIDDAIRQSALMLILCSPASIRRPWLNFEAGAAWMQKVPLIPLCHAGLTLRDLPLPLSSRHGLLLTNEDALRGLYGRVAGVLTCRMPDRRFDTLATSLLEAAGRIHPEDVDVRELDRNRDIRTRLAEALENPEYRWLSLASVAATAGITDELATDYLRADPGVRFSKGTSGALIVGLRSRVGAA